MYRVVFYFGMFFNITIPASSVAKSISSAVTTSAPAAGAGSPAGSVSPTSSVPGGSPVGSAAASSTVPGAVVKIDDVKTDQSKAALVSKPEDVKSEDVKTEEPTHPEIDSQPAMIPWAGEQWSRRKLLLEAMRLQRQYVRIAVCVMM